MRNMGFLTGIFLGYILFTEDGKSMAKKFINTVDKTSEEVAKKGKELLVDAFPNTTKEIKKEGE